MLDLRAGEANLAIRFRHDAPSGAVVIELFRDAFMPVCNPALLPGGNPIEHLGALKGHTLVHCYWSPSEPHAPTWRRWLAVAGSRMPYVPEMGEMDQLSFREELHAIDAVIAGQGITIISDILVGNELAAGTLVKAVDLTLPGFGYYLVHEADHPRRPMIDAFTAWIRSVG